MQPNKEQMLENETLFLLYDTQGTQLFVKLYNMFQKFKVLLFHDSFTYFHCPIAIVQCFRYCMRKPYNK